MSDSKQAADDRPAEDGVESDQDAPEPVSFEEWVESMSEEMGIDPDTVENFAVTLVYDAEEGAQEAATAWATDGHTVPVMALSNGLRSVANQLDAVAGQLRSPNDAPVPSQPATRGFD